MFINGSDLVPPAGFSRIELLDLSGRSILEYPLERNEVDPRFYSVTPFTPPEDYFYVKVSCSFLIPLLHRLLLDHDNIFNFFFLDNIEKIQEKIC